MIINIIFFYMFTRFIY